jgi:hypothetical protein
LPLLIEKLSSTNSNAKIDAMETLVYIFLIIFCLDKNSLKEFFQKSCVNAYGMDAIDSFLQTLSSSLWDEVAAGSDEDVVKCSLDVIGHIAGVSSTEKSGWSSFTKVLLERAKKEIEVNNIKKQKV